MQHSVWVAEAVNSNLEVANGSLADVVPAGVLTKQYSFRRIWQGKGAQTAACKVSMYLLIFMSFGNLSLYLMVALLPLVLLVYYIPIEHVKLDYGFKRNSIWTSFPHKKGWRIRLWVQNPLGTCVNLPIKKGILVELSISNLVCHPKTMQLLCFYQLQFDLVSKIHPSNKSPHTTNRAKNGSKNHPPRKTLHSTQTYPNLL